MSRTLQFKRYPNTTVTSNVGAAGELIIDTSTNSITVHDGLTTGGTRQATESYANTVANTAANTRVLKTGDSMTGSLRISNNTSSLSNTTGALTIVGGMGVTGNVFMSGGRLAVGDSLNHPNIANVFNIASTSGVTAFRSFTMIDTTANIKVVRLGTSDPAIELMKWDTDLTKSNAYFDLVCGYSTYANTFSIRDRNQGNAYRFHITDKGYIGLGAAGAPPLANANLHVFGNAIFTTGVTTSNVYANVVNSGIYLTNTGSDVYLTAVNAYTQANLAAQIMPQNAQTTNYTLQLSDAGKHIYYTQAANTTLYIPTTANVAFVNGTKITIISKTTASANVTLTPNTGVSLYLAGNSTSTSRNVTSYGVASLVQVAANTWFVSGTGVY